MIVASQRPRELYASYTMKDNQAKIMTMTTLQNLHSLILVHLITKCKKQKLDEWKWQVKQPK